VRWRGRVGESRLRRATGCMGCSPGRRRSKAASWPSRRWESSPSSTQRCGSLASDQSALWWPLDGSAKRTASCGGLREPDAGSQPRRLDYGGLSHRSRPVRRRANHDHVADQRRVAADAARSQYPDYEFGRSGGCCTGRREGGRGRRDQLSRQGLRALGPHPERGRRGGAGGAPGDCHGRCRNRRGDRPALRPHSRADRRIAEDHSEW
jgi:hypothetical protein